MPDAGDAAESEDPERRPDLVEVVTDAPSTRICRAKDSPLVDVGLPVEGKLTARSNILAGGVDQCKMAAMEVQQPEARDSKAGPC